MRNRRCTTLRKAPVAAVACVAVALVVSGQPMAAAESTTVKPLRGFAYGYKLNVSIGTNNGPLSTVHTRGYGQETCTSTNNPKGCVPSSVATLNSSPSVELAPGTNGTLSASKAGTGNHTIGSVSPANFFSASGIEVETVGTTTSVASTATIDGINSQTGDEIFQAESLQSTCSLNSSGLTRRTTITETSSFPALVWTDSGQDTDLDGVIEPGEHDAVLHEFGEGDPTDQDTSAVTGAGYQPPVNHAIDGHLHVYFEDGDGNPANGWYTETFTYTFNEQLPNPDVVDGTLVVYGAHMKMHGPLARGDLYIGRVGC